VSDRLFVLLGSGGSHPCSLPLYLSSFFACMRNEDAGGTMPPYYASALSTWTFALHLCFGVSCNSCVRTYTIKYCIKRNVLKFMIHLHAVEKFHVPHIRELL